MHASDARVITASDYTAVVQGIPGTVADSELREWCSHYGGGELAAAGWWAWRVDGMAVVPGAPMLGVQMPGICQPVHLA